LSPLDLTELVLARILTHYTLDYSSKTPVNCQGLRETTVTHIV